MSRHGAGVRARAGTLAGLVDVLTVLVLGAIALLGLEQAFGGLSYALAAGVGLAAGAAVGWVGALRRWNPLSTAAVVVVVAYLLGGPVAYRSLLTGGVVPSLDSLRAVTLGSVTCFKGLVTATPPLSTFPELVLAPFLAALVTAVLAVSFALRLRRHGWALLAPAILFVGVVLVSTVHTVAPVVQGLGFTLLAMVWLAWRRAAQRSAVRGAGAPGMADATDARRLRLRTMRRGAVMIVAIALGVVALGPAVAGAQGRYLLRDVVQPPLDLHQYPSPLEGFRHYVKDEDQTVLFTVRGLPSGTRVRLAVLDTFTGTVMDVAGGDRTATTGGGAFEGSDGDLRASGGDVPAGTAARIEVTVQDYSGVWIPSVGVPTAISFAGDGGSGLAGRLFENSETGTLLRTDGVGKGDSFTLDAVLPPVATESEVAGTRPEVDRSSGYRLETAAGVARAMVGTQTDPLAQLASIRDALVSTGIFSDGLESQVPSRAGHGADRLTALLGGKQMVGDDEQFAAAAALMARSLGYQSRVVMGFYPEADRTPAADGSVDILGTDTHAWLEVNFGGAGWVPFDVTPTQEKPPVSQDPRSVAKPQLQVLQDPPRAEQPAEADAPPVAAENGPDKGETAKSGGHLLVVLAAVGGPLAVLLTPLVLIVAAKTRRRRRRRTARDPVTRMSGGWREIADAAVDLGVATGVGATRREAAAVLVGRGASGRAVAVGHSVDSAVFGSGAPSDADVTALWAEVDAVIHELSGSAGPWRRFRARLSPRSLGLRTRLGTAFRTAPGRLRGKDRS